ncbi:hypothetical protein M413DRAFT_14948 [Hebeloma cylindrosporum]|uniref:Uncharacterized protein n=1 Tax=Hebeloma cylindrosporum TaxID=76867 RepID=A0A0C3BRL5_HEBCY|nr:hypothetical protein M413DRAFT_14948 [Hebeloma cylindrosporum h7]
MSVIQKVTESRHDGTRVMVPERLQIGLVIWGQGNGYDNRIALDFANFVGTAVLELGAWLLQLAEDGNSEIVVEEKQGIYKLGIDLRFASLVNPRQRARGVVFVEVLVDFEDQGFPVFIRSRFMELSDITNFFVCGAHIGDDILEGDEELFSRHLILFDEVHGALSFASTVEVTERLAEAFLKVLPSGNSPRSAAEITHNSITPFGRTRSHERQSEANALDRGLYVRLSHKRIDTKVNEGIGIFGGTIKVLWVAQAHFGFEVRWRDGSGRSSRSSRRSRGGRSGVSNKHIGEHILEGCHQQALLVSKGRLLRSRGPEERVGGEVVQANETWTRIEGGENVIERSVAVVIRKKDVAGCRKVYKQVGAACEQMVVMFLVFSANRAEEKSQIRANAGLCFVEKGTGAAEWNICTWNKNICAQKPNICAQGGAESENWITRGR